MNNNVVADDILSIFILLDISLREVHNLVISFLIYFSLQCFLLGIYPKRSWCLKADVWCIKFSKKTRILTFLVLYLSILIAVISMSLSSCILLCRTKFVCFFAACRFKKEYWYYTFTPLIALKVYLILEFI